MEPEEVERVAFTARLDLEAEEKDRLEDDLEEILDWFLEIDEVETEEVEPAFHPLDLKNELREDEPEETLPQEKVLENTDHEEEGFFKGPRIK